MTHRLVQISLQAVVQESFHLYKDISEVSRSPTRLALPSLPNSNPTQQESFRRANEFSKTCRRRFSHKASKFGSERTSSEDLLDATQNGTSQCISKDLEAYSDHFKQQTDQDETFQMSKSASTLSFPVSNTMADLISLDDWSGQEQETEAKNIKEEQQQQQTNAPTGWELVLAEAIQLPSTQSEPNAPRTPNHTNALPAYKFCPEQKPNTYSAFPEHIPTFNAFPEQEHEGQHIKSGEGWEIVLAENATQPVQPSFDPNLMYNKHVPSVSNTFNALPEQEQKEKEASSRQSWELVLFETSKQPTKQTPFLLENYYPQTSVLPTFSLDNFNNQPAQLPQQHYNPFLKDSNESAIVPVVTGSTIAAFETSFPEKRFLSAHTFQVTPTFTAHNIDTGKGALSASTFQATHNFSAQIPENYTKALPASAFQATPTFSAHNPYNRKVALSAPISQANPTFSPHYLDNGTGASSALTFQATSTFFAHNPDNNGMGVLSAPTIQATPTFSAYNLDKGTGASSAPTFQASPTFSAHCPDNATKAYGNDPFVAFTLSAHNPDNESGVVRNNSSVALAGAQMFEGSRNQQNLMHEQQI
ncbi:hypothetical protein POM88_028284 [Heracleum sosnowskyi]|uniref:Uncharacterized protein n=1 Tax=Heracleum sosnowskyi TaxID=360622 RepID=A0AAD8MM59_9APIA|nr:hypothetical protein POM88_028284 [Heracleum sosnowskyi]